jgi:hypothetical protein
MKKPLTKKEKRINRNTNILLPILAITAATVGFIIRGSIEEKYFQEQEPPRQKITKPQPDTRPYKHNYFPEYETYKA